MQDGDFTSRIRPRSASTSKRSSPRRRCLPADVRDYGRALWFDAYAGGTIFRHLVHPLFVQTVVGPNINNVPTDKAVVDNVLTTCGRRSSAISNSQISGKYLVGDTMTLADIAIMSNFIVYQYLGFEIDAARYPKSRRDTSARSRQPKCSSARWRTRRRLSTRWG